MKPFKFFQKEVKGNLDTLYLGETRATASFNMNDIEFPSLREWNTPQGHNHMRRLYHIEPAEYERQRQIREELRNNLRRDGLTEEEILRNRHEAFVRMRNTNDDMERYFIENGFNGMVYGDARNHISQPKQPKKSWFKKLTDWLDDNQDTVLYAFGLTFAMVTIASFIIYFKKQ